MALTKIQTQNITDNAISSDKLDATLSSSISQIDSISSVASLIPTITTVNVANSTYSILDDTAVALDGGYIVITGTNFGSGAQVLIDGTAATSVTRVSATELRAQVPAKTAASYNLYVVNTSGHTAIRVNGLTYSATPTWVTGSTLDNQAVDVAFSVALDATGAVSYANTTALPAGTDLLSNGYFYGTVTGISVETLYNFTVVAIDAENQDSPREFSITITVAPPAIPAQAFFAGVNSTGFFGLNDTIDRSSPVQLGSTPEWISYTTTSGAISAIKENGTLWSWGSGFFGDLGRNTSIASSSPVQVGSLTNWSKIDSGYGHIVALKDDNTVWTWGWNSKGELGHNDRINKSSPTQVGTQTWLKAIATYNGTFIKSNDNIFWAVGRNEWGQLGLGDTVYRSSPVQLGSNTDWNLMVGAVTSTTLLKNDGTLWSMGQNDQGQLGQNQINTIHRSSPVQVGSLTNWSKISASSNCFFAIKADGTLWSWGESTSGKLGLNGGGNKSSPTQIGSSTDWYELSLSNVTHPTAAGQAAVKTNGTLWIWGRNHRGQLGLGNTIDKSSPTQLGTQTYWLTASANYYGRAFFKQ